VELRELAVFVAVAEERSFTRAAERQHVVQSAVSATLRNLERELGVELVSRTTHQVSLTDAGRLFLPEAQRTLAAAQEARHVLEQARDGLRGTLRLGVMLAASPGSPTPASLIAAFTAAHPGIEVSVRVGVSGDHAEDLRRGRLDLAFIALPPEDVTGVRLHRLLSTRMALVVRPDHPFASRDRVELAELSAEPFVETTPGWGSRIAADRAFLRAGVSRMIRYELGDGLGVLDFVRHGLGVALSPPLIVPPDLVCVPIGRYAPRFVVSLAAADREPSTPVREMLRIAAKLSTGVELSTGTASGRSLKRRRQ
jgi:DNA-binding transcriptional LysR family regulator